MVIYGRKIILKEVTRYKQRTNELLGLCNFNGDIPVIIRIACRELENWYLGYMCAIEAVYPETKASKLIGKAKYRNPDAVFGAFELGQLTRNFSKSHASREIAKYMITDNNNSVSFNHFVSRLDKLISI